jgi:predicted regulator of Ras-like GTPase activity (Roadblock/LC7/MglB family)
MPSLPQLIEDDVRVIDGALDDFLAKSQATAALVAAEGGFVIFQRGDLSRFDPTLLGALAANALSATQAIAGVLSEPNFSAVYQQGAQFSILISQLTELHSLIVVFPATVSVGSIKYFAAFTRETIATQLAKAQERAPDEGLDLAMLNMPDSSQLFRMKTGK